ncbi:MAG TPA: 50S ribosomal protein L5 [Candidatus Paceibacterota bacterium]|nr:50S ribosomal protein L5 [Candidatus Paceibacterota bacterium]
MATNTEQQNQRKEIRAFLEKIVIDAGVGRLGQTPNFEDKTLVQVERDLADIAGQKPQLRRAKKSIAGFKLREGQIVGLRTTLRRDKMVDFFERLITIVLPRVRDFNGLNQSAIDQGGTLNVGIREHQVFPEITPEQSPVSFSIGVSIVPKKKNHDAAVAAFAKFGVPMKKGAAPKKRK